jgi:hypothetical protein
MAGLVDLHHVGDLMLTDLVHVEEIRHEFSAVYVYVPLTIDVSSQAYKLKING